MSEFASKKRNSKPKRNINLRKNNDSSTTPSPKPTPIKKESTTPNNSPSNTKKRKLHTEQETTRFLNNLSAKYYVIEILQVVYQTSGSKTAVVKLTPKNNLGSIIGMQPEVIDIMTTTILNPDDMQKLIAGKKYNAVIIINNSGKRVIDLQDEIDLQSFNTTSDYIGHNHTLEKRLLSIKGSHSHMTQNNTFSDTFGDI